MPRDMEKELKSMGIKFQITDKAKETLVDNGYQERYGARPIRREIQTSVEDAVSSLILSETLKKGMTLKVDAKGGKIVVTEE